MKKRNKLLVAALSMIVVPAAINHYIFSKFPYTSKYGERNKFTYSWRFGEVCYTKMGKGRPLLLVHGLGIGTSSHEFEESARRLSKYYKVYAIDLIGFGMSEKPEISYSSYLFTSLINDFIEHVIKEPVYVAADSNSADFTVLAYSLNPLNFKKMMLIAPTGLKERGYKDLGWLNKLVDFPLYGTFAYNFMSSRLYIWYFLKEHVFYNSDNVNMEMVNKYYEYAHRGGVGCKYPISSFVSGRLNVNISERIKKVQVPVHIIWGSDNDMNSINNISGLKKSSFEYEFTVFDKSKLLPHYEQPLKFVRVCREFFG